MSNTLIRGHGRGCYVLLPFFKYQQLIRKMLHLKTRLHVQVSGISWVNENRLAYPTALFRNYAAIQGNVMGE